MLITTPELAKRLRISTETLRQWVLRFSEHLSEGVSRGEGSTRHFTEDDVLALALVAQMRNAGEPFEVIGERLATGQRGVLEEDPEEDAEPLPPAPIVRQRIQALQQELEVARQDAQSARAQAEQAQGALGEVRASRDQLRADLLEAQQREREMLERAIRAEMRLEFYRAQIEAGSDG